MALQTDIFNLASIGKVCLPSECFGNVWQPQKQCLELSYAGGY